MEGLLFNTSKQMIVGNTERVEVRVASSFRGDLTVGLVGRGPAQQSPMKVGEFMTVQLTALKLAFMIEPESPEKQAVPDTGFAEWDYRVTPLKSGEQELDLGVGVRIKLQGSEEIRFYPVLQRQVHVHVNLPFSISEFLLSYWQWLATAVLIPIAAYLWRARSEKAKAHKAARIYIPNPDDHPDLKL